MRKLLTILLLTISLTRIAQLNIEGKNLTKEKFIAYEVIDSDTVFLGEFKHKYSLELDNTTRHRILFVFSTFIKTLNIENTLEDNFMINIDLQAAKSSEISLVYNEQKNIFQIKNVMAKVK